MNTKKTTRNKEVSPLEIVKKGLRQCYQNRGVIASPVHFSNYWSRDSFWAMPGMIDGDKEDLEMAKSTLDLFMEYQRSDGKIPRKIVSDVNIFKRIGISVKRPFLLPVYASPIIYLYSLDDNLLFVIAFCKYINKTGNHDFANAKYYKLVSSLTFYRQKRLFRKGLLYEFGLGNWMDTILKRGFILYTNCLWYQALNELQKLSEELGREFPSSLPTPQKVRLLIQKEFWNKEEGFFVDGVSKKGKQKMFFDTAGNLLAVLFGIADENQVEQVFKKMKSIRSEQGLHPTNEPLYPFRKVNPLTYLAGIQKYHNGISWSWIEIIYVLSLLKANELKKAREQLSILNELIIKNNSLHETYHLSGEPFGSAIWKSAVPFAWSSGLFLQAMKEYTDKQD